MVRLEREAANTVQDRVVTVTGYVRASVRDRFAALARLEGLSIAAVIRSFVEANAGDASPPPKGGSARRLTMRLSDAARHRLRDVAAARGSTPTAYAAALIEAHMLRQPQWSREQLDELRATRRIVAEVRDKLSGHEAAKGVEASLALIDAAIRKDMAWWGATTPTGVPVPASAVPSRARRSHAGVSPAP